MIIIRQDFSNSLTCQQFNCLTPQQSNIKRQNIISSKTNRIFVISFQSITDRGVQCWWQLPSKVYLESESRNLLNSFPNFPKFSPRAQVLSLRPFLLSNAYPEWSETTQREEISQKLKKIDGEGPPANLARSSAAHPQTIVLEDAPR